jgi:SAM-dependent methyltransferase
MTDDYRNDLAYIHDAGFGHFARHAAGVLLTELQRRHLHTGLVIDLGCGSGILAAALAAAGFEVLGFDISRAMLALARNQAPTALFRRQSLWTAKLPSCIAVTAIGECLNYLFDRRSSRTSLTQLFRRVHAALCPGGLFLFDVAGPGRVPGSGHMSRCWVEKDWAALVTTEEDRRRKLLTRRITSFCRVGKLYRRDCEVHRLRLFRGVELAEQLQRIGFRVRVLRRYQSLPFPRGVVGLLARKQTKGAI